MYILSCSCKTITYDYGEHVGGINISRNIGAWSQAANMLYLDSPSGVGLSYSETEEDYVTNDTHTAHDSNIFLHEFFREYETFAKHPFYISGDTLSS